MRLTLAPAYPTCKSNTLRHGGWFPGGPTFRARRVEGSFTIQLRRARRRRAQGVPRPLAWGSRGASTLLLCSTTTQHESASPFARRRRRSGAQPAQEPQPSRHGSTAARRPATRQGVSRRRVSTHGHPTQEGFQGGEERRKAAVLTVVRRCSRGRLVDGAALVLRRGRRSLGGAGVHVVAFLPWLDVAVRASAPLVPGSFSSRCGATAMRSPPWLVVGVPVWPPLPSGRRGGGALPHPLSRLPLSTWAEGKTPMGLVAVVNRRFASPLAFETPGAARTG
jgi:hypothetical protein